MGDRRVQTRAAIAQQREELDKLEESLGGDSGGEEGEEGGSDQDAPHGEGGGAASGSELDRELDETLRQHAVHVLQCQCRGRAGRCRGC